MSVVGEDNEESDSTVSGVRLNGFIENHSGTNREEAQKAVGSGCIEQLVVSMDYEQDSSKETVQSQTFDTLRVDSNENDVDSISSDRESTCTVRSIMRAVVCQPSADQSDGHTNCLSSDRIGCDQSSEQILSAKSLQFEIEECERIEQHLKDEIDQHELIEVDLGLEHNSNEQSKQLLAEHEASSQMFAPQSYRSQLYGEADFKAATSRRAKHEPQIQTQTRVRGFAEVQPKLTVASQRVREYFESLKFGARDSSSSYQFFKSIRTEFVACLLFCLISSQALIACRLQWNSSSDNYSSQQINSNSNTINDEITSNASSDNNNNNNLNRASIHLTHGLADSLVVATLTQVFGHISGCHLSPSISLALYVKGHITSLRLATYLAAQSLGALAGVGLLALLTSSQINLGALHEPAIGLTGERRPHDQWSIRPAANGFGQHQRSRRQANGSNETGPIVEAESFSAEPSERLLMSILEQVELERAQQRQASTKSGRPMEGNSLPAAAAAVGVAQTQETGPSAAKLTTTTYATILPALERRDSAETTTTQVTWGQLRPTISAAGTYQDDLGPAPVAAFERDSDHRLPVPPAPTDERPARVRGIASTKLRLRRRKRNRRQEQPQQPQQPIASEWPPNEGFNLSNLDSMRVNLLHLALPDPIMSFETSAECLRLQVGDSGADNATRRPSSIVLGATQLAYANCLSLPNASQMFILQLIGSLLVLLTYLVNSDPRRVDLGYKSLSIGLAYFVASLLTSHAGGYFTNPSQVLALLWLSSGPMAFLSSGRPLVADLRWHDEWLVYLIVPLVSGLFGALSHEYIDFTSPRNRNKELQLRRSFHSLDASANSIELTDARRYCQSPLAVGTGSGEQRAPEVESSPASNSAAHHQRPADRDCGVKLSASSSLASSESRLNVSPCCSGSGASAQKHPVGIGANDESNGIGTRWQSRPTPRSSLMGVNLVGASPHRKSALAAAATTSFYRRPSDYDANFLISSMSLVGGCQRQQQPSVSSTTSAIR